MSNTSGRHRGKTELSVASPKLPGGGPPIFRGYKTELDPTKSQRQMFLQYSGAARFVYNWGLEQRKKQYESTGKSPSFYDQCKELVKLKHGELTWLQEVASWVPLGSLLDLDRAFKNFFRRCKEGKGKPGFPRFKSRNRGIGGFRFFQGIRVQDDRVRLPRIGWVRLKERGYIPTAGVKIKHAAVSERASRWFVSVLVEEPHAVEKAQGPPLGVDLGIKMLATCSDGRTFENARSTYRHEKKLARLQRQMARRKKGSKNREKTKRKIAECHYRIACIRSYAIHNATAAIVARTRLPKDRPSCIVVEDLNISGMMQNHCLAKAIADAGMGQCRRQIEYKASWFGIDLMAADRFYPSSKVCSSCGHKKPLLKLSEREFVCEKCGVIVERDLNAARNLAGLSTANLAGIDACGESVRPVAPSGLEAVSLKQEPMRARGPRVTEAVDVSH